MSYTTIHTFGHDGRLRDECTFIQNAWRGGMALWLLLEKKYLPPLNPLFPKSSRVFSLDPEISDEFWHLIDDDRLSGDDRVALATTYDHVLVRRENLPRVIKAFRSSEFEETSLPEQADALSKIYEDEDVSAVGWQQTSVSDDMWCDWDDEKDEGIPYNWKEGDRHWFLFDDYPQLKVM